MATLFLIGAIAYTVGALRHPTHPWTRWIQPFAALVIAVGFALGNLHVVTWWIGIVGTGIVLLAGGSIAYNRWRAVHDPAQWQLDRQFGPTQKVKMIQPNPRSRD